MNESIKQAMHLDACKSLAQQKPMKTKEDGMIR